MKEFKPLKSYNKETVFDHNITPEEWNYICSLDKETYLKVVDEDTAKIDIACLLYYRGAPRNDVEKYLNGLPPLDILDFWRSVTHP